MLSRWVSGLLLQLHSNPCALEQSFSSADESRLLAGLPMPTAHTHGLTDGLGVLHIRTARSKALRLGDGLIVDGMDDAYGAEQQFAFLIDQNIKPDPIFTHFNTDINGHKQRGHTHPHGHFP